MLNTNNTAIDLPVFKLFYHVQYLSDNLLISGGGCKTDYGAFLFV